MYRVSCILDDNVILALIFFLINDNNDFQAKLVNRLDWVQCECIMLMWDWGKKRLFGEKKECGFASATGESLASVFPIFCEWVLEEVFWIYDIHDFMVIQYYLKFGKEHLEALQGGLYYCGVLTSPRFFYR